MADKCIRCGFNTKKTCQTYRERRRLIGNTYEWHRNYLRTSGVEDVEEESVICGKCRTKLNKERDIAVTDDPAVQSTDHDSTVVLEHITKIGQTSSKCVACGALVKSGVTTLIPHNARMDLLIYHDLLVDSNSRICRSHLDGVNLKSAVEVQSNSTEKATLSPTDASQCITFLTEILKERSKKSYIDFNDPQLTDADYKTWTGWTRTQFESMLTYLNGTSRMNRDKRNALAMFWIKLKTNLSFQQIALLFHLDNDNGHKIVSFTVHSVADQLHCYFVPHYLGVDHLSREEAISHNTIFSSTFFGSDRLMTVWDGTYFYIEKSGEHEFARKTYSGHKNRPLIKFMSIVLPDGYVLETIGPYMSDGKNNDANMTRHIIIEQQNLINFMNDDDVMILDRGFRDCIQELEMKGIKCKMPSYLPKGVAQHTEEESNTSRLITKVRWVVEAYHGRLKKWIFFDQRVSNHHLPYMHKFVRIATAALNAFPPPLCSDKEGDAEMAEEMLRRSTITNNAVFERVEKGGLSSRGGHWVVMSSDAAAPGFPQISEDQLYELTHGIYQLKQAVHYTNEHFDQHGDYEVHTHNEAPDLLRAHIQSRHVGAKRYFCWIEYGPKKEESDAGIKGWYCQCKPGKRQVGCCAHIASILWYLGFARHHDFRPAKKPRVLLNAAEHQ